MNQCLPAPRVLVFDSGVGALGIGADIHRLLPDIDLLYVMDRGGFPYGLWREQALAEHICKQLITLLHREAVDMVVMACNSASTVVLPALRAELHVPVVGVVPAIKPAAQTSSSGVIGLLATPGTVSRPYTAQLIADFAADCSVIAVGDSALAAAVEALFWEGRDSPTAWQGAVAKLAAHPRFAEMDTVVLACTHFPMVKGQLAEALAKHGKTVHWVDSGQAIARRVAHLLAELKLPRQAQRQGIQQARVLGSMPPSTALPRALRRRGITLLP